MATQSAETGTVQILLFTGLCLALLSLLFKVLSQKIAKNGGGDLPPMHTGWIPWVGCAVEFGKAPVYYIEEKRKEVWSHVV